MKRILILCAIGSLAYSAYYYLYKLPLEKHPLTRLSIFIDEHVDAILGPLPDVHGLIPTSSYTHDLRLLRENIIDLSKDTSSKDSLRYTEACRLCDSLIYATSERDVYIARLNDTRSKTKESPMARNPIEDLQERLAFFENGIRKSWLDRSVRLRSTIDYQYARLRSAERE